MENKSFLSRWFSSVGEKLADQTWYQQLKAKWDETDPQSRTYIQATFAILLLAGVATLVIGSVLQVRGVKKELTEKNELVTLIQSATNEMRQLKDSAPAGARTQNGGNGPWAPFLEQVATSSGIDKAALTVANEKTAPQPKDAPKEGGTKETLMDVTLKKVNIKQVIRFINSLENGSRPVKLRALSIDTKNEATGYLDAVLSISGFSLAQPS